MLNRRFAEGMVKKHTRARGRFPNVTPASEPSGHVSVQYTRILDKRTATLSSHPPHPTEAEYWKLKWLKATVTFLRDLGRVLRNEEKAMRRLGVQPKALPIKRVRIETKLSAGERRERAMLLQAARRDKESEADVKIRKITRPLRSAATATVQGLDEDRPPRNMLSTPAPTIKKIEQTFTHMRLISRLRASPRRVRLTAKRVEPTVHCLRYHDRHHDRLRARLGIVKDLSKSATTAVKREQQGHRIRNQPSTSAPTATKRAPHKVDRLHYADWTDNRRTGSIFRGKVVRRIRPLMVRQYKSGSRLDQEQSDRRDEAHQRYVVGREKESLWNTMRAAANGGIPVLAPTSRRRPQAEKLVESVREFFSPDTTAAEMQGESVDDRTPGEYSEGEYKPFRG